MYSHKHEIMAICCITCLRSFVHEIRAISVLNITINLDCKVEQCKWRHKINKWLEVFLRQNVTFIFLNVNYYESNSCTSYTRIAWNARIGDWTRKHVPTSAMLVDLSFQWYILSLWRHIGSAVCIAELETLPRKTLLFDYNICTVP